MGFRTYTVEIQKEGVIQSDQRATLAIDEGTGKAILDFAATFPNHRDMQADFGAGLDFSGQVLQAAMNVIRGISVNPTRVSGWTAFSGTVDDAPAQVYTDYRELHTTGAAEVLGPGSFAFMDSGAACVSMFAGQDIAEADAGSTVLSAGDAPAVGVFARWLKVLLNGETFTPGGVAAVQFLSFQANVTDVQAEDTSIWNVEVASGGIRSLFRFRHSASEFATNFFELDSEIEPIVTWEPTIVPQTDAPSKGLRVKVGSAVYNIPAYLVP
jgi:hypothetical protein